MGNGARRGFCIVTLVALGLRLAYLFQVRGTPVTDLLLIDSATYDRFARMILAGTFRGEDVYTMNPLYPYFVAGVYAVTRGSTMAVLVAQAMLGALTAGGVFALGKRCFDVRTGWVAGLIAAAYAPSIFYSSALLTPVLIEACGVAALLLLATWRDAPRTRLLIGAGLCTGLATLSRGGAILWVPLAGFFFRAALGAWSRAARPWAAFAVAALALIALVTLRNAAVEGRFVPVSANYAAFYLGHGPEANGLYVMPKFTQTAAFEGEVAEVRNALSREAGRPLTQAEVSGELFRRGARWVAAHPLEEGKLLAIKLYYFWNRSESPTNLSFYFAREFSSLLRALPIGFGVVAPLGLAGMVMTRRRWRDVLLLHLSVAVPLAVCLLFFVSAEYRMPAVAALTVFAAAALTRAAAAIGAWMRPEAQRAAEGGRAARRPETARKRSQPAAGIGHTGPARAASHARAGSPTRDGWLALALLPVFAVACNVRTPLMVTQALNRVPFYNAGVLYKSRGRLDRAEAMLRRSLAIDPSYAPALEAMADLENRRGNSAAAMGYRDAALRADPKRAAGAAAPPEARERIAAEALFQAGRYEEALAEFERLAKVYETRGDHEAAISVDNNLGLTLHRMKRDAEAERVLRGIIATDPGYLRAHTNLALVLEARGRRAEAEAEYRRALEIEPTNARARRALERLGGAR